MHFSSQRAFFCTGISHSTVRCLASGCQAPVLQRSSFDKNLAFSSLAMISSVVGIRKGSGIVIVFSLQKSTTILTVPSFLRIGMGGLDHCEVEMTSGSSCTRVAIENCCVVTKTIIKVRNFMTGQVFSLKTIRNNTSINRFITLPINNSKNPKYSH